MLKKIDKSYAYTYYNNTNNNIVILIISYPIVKSEPFISRTIPGCAKFDDSNFSATLKPRKPSVSSSPNVHSSEYSLRCFRSRYFYMNKNKNKQTL